MKIAVIGTGYVGLVTGTCLAEMGNDVFCVDTDTEKITELQHGHITIYEPGLLDLMKKNFACKRLRFTTSLAEAVTHAKICFISVGTPMGEDGSADLSYVLQVADGIGAVMEDYLCIVDKSTVPVGTSKMVRRHIQIQLDKRGCNIEFDVASNPEFLKEGTAIADCLKPDRIVLGVDNERTWQLLAELYKPYTFNCANLLRMDIASAEMTKYAANAMLALKISYMNEIAGICEQVGADVNLVRLGIGSDRRIGYSFIYPGCGYGGSCFPKDVKALLHTAEGAGCKARLISAIEEVNTEQKYVLVKKVQMRFGENLKGRKFAIWGLAFKPDTDDMRESAALTVIRSLLALGAEVQVYDPQAMGNAQKYYFVSEKKILYCKNKYDALNGAEALLLLTEWKEFRSPDFYEITNRLKQPLIFDGRNQYDKYVMQRYGIEYFQIGVAQLEVGKVANI